MENREKSEKSDQIPPGMALKTVGRPLAGTADDQTKESDGNSTPYGLKNSNDSESQNQHGGQEINGRKFSWRQSKGHDYKLRSGFFLLGSRPIKGDRGCGGEEVAAPVELTSVTGVTTAKSNDNGGGHGLKY